MNAKELQHIIELHEKWLNNEECGVKANLSGANLDFSCWPLWCGTLSVKVDAKIAAQLMYHACALDCNDPDFIAARNAALVFANKIQR